MRLAIRRMLTVTASTKRSPVTAGGKRGRPTVYLSSIHCAPLDPVNPELAQRMGLETPLTLLQTYTEAGVDIRQNDILTVAGVDYPVRACGVWANGVTPDGCNALVVEDLKR